MWPGLTDETREAILSAGHVPRDARSTACDPTWGPLFGNYIEANEGGVDEVSYFVYFMQVEPGTAEFGGLNAAFGSSGSWPITWPDDIGGSLEAGLADESAAAELRREMRAYVEEQLSGWHTVFVDEVERVGLANRRDVNIANYANTASAEDLSNTPVETGLGVEDIDRAYVESMSKYNLDNSSEGDVLSFLLLRAVDGLGMPDGMPLLLIGDGFPPTYTRAVSMDRGVEGQVKMVRKGGIRGAGKVKAVCSSQDQGDFKIAYRRISKKDVEFGRL